MRWHSIYNITDIVHQHVRQYEWINTQPYTYTYICIHTLTLCRISQILRFIQVIYTSTRNVYKLTHVLSLLCEYNACIYKHSYIKSHRYIHTHVKFLTQTNKHASMNIQTYVHTYIHTTVRDIYVHVLYIKICFVW